MNSRSTVNSNRFRWPVATCWIVLAFLAPHSIVQAQDEPKPAPAKPADAEKAEPAKEAAKPAADAPDAAAARKAFEAVLAEWKEGLKKLTVLRQEYRTANGGKKAELEKQFNELRQKLAVEVQPRLIESAEQLYVAAPGKDDEVTNFLTLIVLENLEKDRTKEAYRVAKLLLDGGTSMGQLDLFAAIAAFGEHDFDLAAEKIKKSHEAGLLDREIPEGAPESTRSVMNAAHHTMASAEEYKALWKKEQEIREKEAKADDLPRVKLTTTKGDIVIELFENQAPNTVANFISLVEKKFYDNVKFHRVLPLFMAQGGDPEGTGTGGPGYTIRDEINRPDYRRHFTGSLSMAKSAAPDSGGSQFFLTFRPTPHLNGIHTVFGRVIEGMDVLEKLERVNPETASPNTPIDKIVTATVVRKRDHEYTPEVTR